MTSLPQKDSWCFYNPRHGTAAVVKFYHRCKETAGVYVVFSPMLVPRFSCRLRHIKKIWMLCAISLTSVAMTVLIYQILFLDDSEFLTEYQDEHQKWNSLKDWPKVLRYKLIQVVGSNKTFSSCPTLSIHRKPVSTPSATCQLPKVREDACTFAKSIFSTDPLIHACNSSQVNLCKMEKIHSGSAKVQCHTTSCGSSDIISVGFINPHDGSLAWGHFSFLQDVEKSLNNYVQNTASKEYFPFAFLRCDEFWNPTAKTQLLILPPKGVVADKPHKRLKEKPININIMLIDSVSRPHFYRSLPQTVKAFRDINAKSSARVLDFELFHAIKPRTFETIHALFSGELLEVDQFVNPVAVKAGVMFDKFKSVGYQTMWQEDMCWTYEWGLVRDLKIMNKSRPLAEIWHNLTTALKNNSIDFTGITHSSCEVLKSFGVPEIFHGPSKLCYGGKHYHSFFLLFLDTFLEQINSDTEIKPLFSFSMLDVGHEDSGLRIQTLDTSLASFVKSVASDQNTLSIILSDHGNTYGSFPITMEGRFEMFQPHLFFIIPNRIQNLLGKVKMRALIQNQKRMTSIVDLHHTLMAVGENIGGKSPLRQNQGLLQPISRNRSCEDLGLLPSTLCICQGWERKVHTNSFHFIVAEFALGKLNEKIQSQYLKLSGRSRQVSGFGSCERLRGERFDNVREKRVDETLTVSLDIYVQHQQLFSVVVQVISGSVLLEMKLLRFTRFSQYGIYQACADKGVDLRLCICEQTSDTKSYLSTVKSETHTATKEPPTPEWQYYGDIFNSATRADNMHENCLFILFREYKSGVIFEVANSCSFVFYTIELHLMLSNMQVSERIPLHKEVKPGTIHFLIAVIQLDPNVNWSWKYTLNFSWKVLH